ncbi:MAG: helix-turn-helix domain-containing protein [Alphaproteobacteria bacterium]
MKPEDFKRWRKSLAMSQKEAAEALGLKRRVVQYYEKGERNGEKVVIPKSVSLACFALAQGVTEYRGPTRQEAQEMRAAAKDGKKKDKAADKKGGEKKK